MPPPKLGQAAGELQVMKLLEMPLKEKSVDLATAPLFSTQEPLTLVEGANVAGYPVMLKG